MLRFLGIRRNAGWCAIALAATFFSGSAGAETWKCYTYIPAPTHVVFVGLNRIAERLKEITKGKIDYKCNVGGSLPIEANSIAPAMADGVIDLASTAYVSGLIPVSGIVALPGFFATMDEFNKGYEAVAPILTAEFDKNNIVLLGKYVYPRQVIWSKGKIGSLADISGRSVRVQSIEQSEFVKRFGGVPVSLAPAEVATSLQRGVIAAVLTAAAGGGRLWIDLLDHTFEVGPSFAVSFIVVNKKKFNSLSADEQAALRKAVAEETNAITKKLNDENASLLADFAKKSLTIVPSTQAEEALLRERMESYWKVWAQQRGDLVVKALDTLRAAVGK